MKHAGLGIVRPYGSTIGMRPLSSNSSWNPSSDPVSGRVSGKRGLKNDINIFVIGYFP